MNRDELTNKWFNVDSVEVHISEELKRFVDVNDFFSNDKLVRFSGAPRDSRLRVLPETSKDGKRLEGIRLSVEHHAVVAMERVIHITPDRGGLLTNATFRVRASHRGNRLGARALAVQAEAAREEGFEAIRLDAIGSFAEATAKHLDDRFIGYWLWPRLGFDAPIPDYVRSKLSPKFSGCNLVSELMETQEGVDEWQLYGDTLLAARFDLSENSTSWKLLLRYLHSHGIQV